MDLIEGKVRDYLLEQTGGKLLPSGECPSLAEFAKQVMRGEKFWPRQKLILKCVINALAQRGMFSHVPLTKAEEKDLQQMLQNAQNPVGDGKYAQAIIRHTPNSSSPLVILLVCGRGSGKTFLSGFLVSLFIRFLVSLADAHKFFGLAKVKPIAIQCLAGKESQAVSLFRVVKTNVGNCPELQGTYDEFKESIKFGNVVEARAYTSNANTVRGEDTFLYYHEETCFCAEDTPDSEKSFTQCYRAIQPAVKNRFAQHGTMLFVTSAGMKTGQTWKLYKDIRKGLIENCVMFQLAIWEVNPRFSKKDFDQEYAEDAVTADAEHGSQFVDAMHAFLTEEEVRSCIEENKKRVERGDDAIQYWIHLDPSRKHDRYAIALGHKEKHIIDGQERIYAVIDHVQYWEAFWKNDKGEMVRPRTAKERKNCTFVGVNTQEILAYLHGLVENFNVIGVSSDQFESQYIIEEMNEAYGTEEFPFGFIHPITEKLNWLAYRNLKKLISHGNFRIYDEKAFIEEALVLIRYNKNKPLDVRSDMSGFEEDEEGDSNVNPNLIYSVEAPRSGSVTTDDVVDAVTFCAFHMMSNMDLAPANMKDLAVGSARKPITFDEPEKAGQREDLKETMRSIVEEELPDVW